MEKVWKRRKIEVPFLAASYVTTEWFATSTDGREFALRKVDDIYVLYVDGVQHKSQLWFASLREGRETLDRAKIVPLPA